MAVISSRRKKETKIIKNWRKESRSIEKYQFLHHFLPDPDKGVRSAFLSIKALFIYTLIMLSFMTLFRLFPRIVPGVLGYASDISVSDLLQQTNNERHNKGLNDLVLNDALSKAAAEKASHMFEKGYWAHISPDGVEPWDFILGVDYDYIYAGENLAKNFSTSKGVVEAWMNSPTHRDNLLSGNYDEVGFAVVNGVLDGYETTLVVQMFGRPRNPSQVATVNNDETQRNTTERTAIAGDESESITNEVNTVPNEIVLPSGEASASPMLDVTLLVKTVTILFALFLGSLLGADIIYSRRKGIAKFTGHTVAHLTMLILIIFSIWFVLAPGVIL